MVETKFRIWDKKNKELYQDGSVKISLDGRIFLGGTNNLGHYKGDDLIVMQYIWRKDKNEKEIYDGDIIEIEKNYDSISKYIVGVDVERAKFGIKKVGFDSYSMFGFSVIKKKQIEVIGNIYQDKELLNELNN